MSEITETRTETVYQTCERCGMSYSRVARVGMVTTSCPNCKSEQRGEYNLGNIQSALRSGEIDPNPPTCKSCGKSLSEHTAEGLCGKLEEAKRILAKAGLVLDMNGHSAMAGIISAFLKELE